ncbi:MAG: transcriptional regulator [Microbacterium sp.]|nr:transcriptional regulator [Microbacterium sp.]
MWLQVLRRSSAVTAVLVLFGCTVHRKRLARTPALRSEQEAHHDRTTPPAPQRHQSDQAEHVSGEEFITAMAALYAVATDDELCAPFLHALPVTGAAISTLADPFGVETVCASDATAARLDELQIDLGEGPSWEAMRTGRPVLEPAIHATTTDRWPVMLMAIRDTNAGAVFAFPMRVGALSMGAVGLYRDTAGPLSGRAVDDATALSAAAARYVLRRALLRADSAEADTSQPTSRYSRREVYQASGIIAGQTGLEANDALLLLRAYAFTGGRTVRELANEVIAHTVDFTDPDDTAL